MPAVRGADGRFIKGSGAPGWTPSGGTTAASGRLFSVTLDKRALKAFQKRVERYQGKPLAYRLDRGTSEAAKLLVPSVRAAAPKGPTGNLKKSIRAYSKRSKGGGSTTSLLRGPGISTVFMASQGSLSSAFVGPSSRVAPHRHLVIRGHSVVTPGGRDTGRQSIPNPFVDNAVKPRAAEAIRVVSRAIFGEG